MFYLSACTLTGVAILGFAAGLFLFKVKSRWCPGCGSKFTCPVCTQPGGRQAQVER
ncbi:hypothetical protein ACNTMW_20615 [Planosporangium sp. 12N6]|uniref:hypothetical protein n=1 Tax=Planosporangium spinosum TaxID=3402278 RepID=UPI003CEB512A